MQPLIDGMKRYADSEIFGTSLPKLYPYPLQLGSLYIALHDVHLACNYRASLVLHISQYVHAQISTV